MSATIGSRPLAADPAAETWDFLENAGVAFHWVAEDGTILWANQAELDLMGYPAAEYIGHNIAEFYVDPSVIADILTRLRNSERLKGYEAEVRSKDGSVRHIAISSSVYRRDGKFIHTRCVTVDLTARRNANELQQRLGAIVESSDDAIIAKDLDGTILSWNRGAERIFGYQAEDVIGKNISILAAPDRVDEIPDILSRLQRGERINHHKTKRKTKDGRILTISLTVSPLFDPRGSIVGASKVARDITQSEIQAGALQAAHDALMTVNADMEQFLYSASHDLQEPLRMVATYSELLMRTFHDQLGPEGLEYLDYVLQGALRMEQLLKDLRSYALVSSLHKEPVDFIDSGVALDRALANLRPAVVDTGARITITALPRVRFHEFCLEQVFQNLISNALRYRSAAPPEIRISGKPEGNGWLFAVRDNGIGIDPRYQEQVFDLFKRLHSVADCPG
ncbi:MAG TPA: PAS domain S-box protein, partial [Bryobacteraceae bacterium]|nr:PAS domain S-box protein [Bryobacteraceae bacterium]